jgi:hypothetical protein
MSTLTQFTGSSSGSREATYGLLKTAIVLFETNPGTRNWVCPAGVSSIRAFVVGGGGGGPTGANNDGAGGGYAEKVIAVTPGTSYSYTVGVGGPLTNGAAGGTSSFAATISATGGLRYVAGSEAGGVGTGGDTNNAGEVSGTGKGGAGHAFGVGGVLFGNAQPSVDGWKIGLLPGFFNYGRRSNTNYPAGMGGSSGGLASMFPGFGAGGGNNLLGGTGVVGIEVLA